MSDVWKIGSVAYNQIVINKPHKMCRTQGYTLDLETSRAKAGQGARGIRWSLHSGSLCRLGRLCTAPQVPREDLWPFSSFHRGTICLLSCTLVGLCPFYLFLSIFSTVESADRIWGTQECLNLRGPKSTLPVGLLGNGMHRG